MTEVGDAAAELVEYLKVQIHSCFVCDSEQMKQTLKNEFPGRVACSDREASRNTVEGMRDALCDMLVLSHTNYFLGSYYSSFSDIVLELNGKGEIVVN